MKTQIKSIALKLLVSCLIVSCLMSTSNAQWTDNGTFVNSNDHDVTISSNNPSLRLFDNTVAEYRVEGQLVEKGNDILLESLIGDLFFRTGTSGTATTRMVITSTGEIGIGTALPQAAFHIIGGDFLVGQGTLGSNNKMYWNESKGAFRAGGLTNYGQTFWDLANLGTFSFAAGKNTEARGDNGATALGYLTSANGDDGATALGFRSKAMGDYGATALGNLTDASGDNGATALGYETTASGDDGATALGYETIASGNDGATAIGSYTTASGTNGATALGYHNEAASDKSICIGSGVFFGPKLVNNISQSLMVGFNSDIPTLVVRGSFGAGTTGKVGIATTTPNEKLQVNGGLNIGNTTTTNSGTMRFNGSNFQGYDGSAWKNLDDVTAAIIWSINGPNAFYNAGKVGIGTSSPITKLHLKNGDFLVGSNTIGTGNKMFWNATKAAFRAGGLNNTNNASNWNLDSLGTYSFAAGKNTKANGSDGATALGLSTIASGDDGATALGYSAIASGNYGATALGFFANASGNFCATALGNQTTASGDFGATSLGFFTTASGDNGATALGYYSAASGNGGAIALGRAALASGEDGATALGHQTTASGNNGATALGYATEAAGIASICIGSGDNPSNKLINNINQSLMIGFNSTAPTLFVGPSPTTTTTGKVGIGTTTPTHDLHVAGDIAVAGQIVHPSDINLKENIAELKNGLSTINQLSPKSYTHKLNKAEEFGLSTKPQFGLIAQEVEEVLPELVIQKALVGEDGEIYKGLDYEKLIPILVAALQEADKKIDSQNQTIQNHQSQVLSLKSHVQKLEANSQKLMKFMHSQQTSK